MKRIIALILALVMTMALVACGGDKLTTSTPTTPSTPGNPTTSTPSTTNPSTSTPATPDKPVEDPDAWKYGGDLVVGTANAWNTFDPVNTNGILGPCLITLHVWEAFAILDANGQVYGQVFDFEESADGCTITLTLRERYFSNGEKITMEDALASLHRTVGDLSEAEYDKYWPNVTMKVEGDTITFTLAEYNIKFLDMFANAYSAFKIMPKEICDKYPVTGGVLQPNGFIRGGTAAIINDVKDAIGSGPYTLSKYSEEEVVLARNEKYVPIVNEGAIGVAKEAKCYLDTVTVQLNTDAASRTAATMAGEYHVGSIQSDMVETALTMGVKKVDSGTAWTHAIFFNLHESNADSPVADVNVRKAIRAAIDCNAVMLSVVSGDASRINLDPYPVSKAAAAYNTTILEDSGEWNVADQALAKEYLAKSSYNGEPIVYLTNATGAFYRAAMAVVPMMESIGLKVELMAVDGGSHGAMRKDPATGHDIGCWEVQKNEENPVLHTTFVTGTQGWWTSPEKAAAIAIMKTTPTGSAESVKAYNDYLDCVVNEVPYILFGHLVGYTWTQGDVVLDSVGQTVYHWNSYLVK